MCSYPTGWVPLVVVGGITATIQNQREIHLHYDPSSPQLVAVCVTIDTAIKQVAG